MYRAVLKTQPDGKLATLAAAGSEPAFEVIVHRYRRPLLGYCRSRLRLSDGHAEDVVQQAFMNAWGSLRSGSEVCELRPWLYRIVHNQAVTMMRTASCADRSLRDLTNAPPGTLGGEHCDMTRPADHVYEEQARLRETLTAVAALPELQRQALWATAIDGLSYDEVADELDTSSDAVRGLVYRARNALRAGVAVVFPGPLVLWAANQASQTVSSDSVQQWMSEAAVGGGSVGISAAVTKGAVVLASSVAVVGSGVGAGLATHVFSPGANPGLGQAPRRPGAANAPLPGGRPAHITSASVHTPEAGGLAATRPGPQPGTRPSAPRLTATPRRAGQLAIASISPIPREGSRLTEGRPAASVPPPLAASGAPGASAQASPAGGVQIGSEIGSAPEAGRQSGSEIPASGAQTGAEMPSLQPRPTGSETVAANPGQAASRPAAAGQAASRPAAAGQAASRPAAAGQAASSQANPGQAASNQANPGQVSSGPADAQPSSGAPSQTAFSPAGAAGSTNPSNPAAGEAGGTNGEAAPAP